tara:strand:+ start:725 stop:1252 length:528 start_codon:yes stop_codon:yes gene_type:complete
VKNMKLIMESWRKFKEAKNDFPADGLSPVDSSVYDTHSGGAEADLRGAPLKNRRQISIYPKPGTIFDPSTGEFDVQTIDDLLSILDSDKDLMMSEDDPYVDDWLEKTHEAFMAAIEAFKKKGREEQETLDDTLDAKFASAISDIRAIIKARDSNDTLDVTDPRVKTVVDLNLPTK